MTETDDSAYRIFARFYPHEAYNQDPKRFCEFMRSEGYDLTDEQIKEHINATK